MQTAAPVDCVRHADMPLTPANVWREIQGNNVRVDMAVE